MALQCGIVGLPNVGKSTIFNALTRAGAQVANYPFCTIEPNIGVVEVPDSRLDRLADLYHPKKVTPTLMQFVDIAGIVKDAAKGEGLGNKFLSHIREVDAIAHVVRCFEDPEVVHVNGAVDPKQDIAVVEMELALADLESLEGRIARLERSRLKRGDPGASEERDFLVAVKSRLERGELGPPKSLSPEELKWLAESNLLTMKPVLTIANIGESDIGKPLQAVESVKTSAAARGARMVVLSGKVESEIALLDPGERAEYLREVGLSEPGLFSLIREAYDLLGLITFLTAGPEEVRAWTIRRGTRASEAAGKIHSDMERGFIRAEVVAFADMDRLGNPTAVRENGLLRTEGRDYIIADGDILLMRFNV